MYKRQGDPARLRQVFINVLDNAIKYSPKGGVITIELLTDASNAYVSIMDQGPGISPEDLENVRIKFYKGKGAVRGSGIGLAVVDEIMQAHGGALDIQSEVGHGTTVTLRLPIYHREKETAVSYTHLDVYKRQSVSFTEDLKETFSNMLEKIDTIVVVLIVSAGVLAFVVLYNLTNINITERVKEIATIKVLGFYDKEVSAYVYRESIALSIIGTLVGLVLGIFLHMFVIRTAEVDAVMFGRTIKTMSYVYSALLTMVFSCLVNLVMHRKLRSISMVESMKAPE